MRHLLLLAALTGCKSLDEAPLEISEPTLFLLSTFDGDAGDLAQGVLALEQGLADLDLEGDLEDRSFAPPPLTAADRGGMGGPAGRDPEEQWPAAVAGVSRWPIGDHRRLTVVGDRGAFEGEEVLEMRREVLSGDAGCFPETTELVACGRLETTNYIHQESTLTEFIFDSLQDYRLLDLGDGRVAEVGRGWVEDRVVGVDGDDVIEERFVLDVWLPEAGGERTWRYYAIWATLDVALLSEDLYTAYVVGSMDGRFQDNDAWIGDNLR